MTPIQLAFWGTLAVALSASVVSDLHSRRVLDAVTYPAFLLLLALRFFGEGVGDAERGLLSGVLGSAISGGVFSLWAFRGRMGWGDVKLVAVAGAAFGWPQILSALVFISLAGALQAVLSLLLKGEALTWISEKARNLSARFTRNAKQQATSPRHIPYAVAIALGSALALWWDSGV